jgi:hypothetical protein
LDRFHGYRLFNERKQSSNRSTLIPERVVQSSKTGQGSPVEIPQGAKKNYRSGEKPGQNVFVAHELRHFYSVVD